MDFPFEDFFCSGRPSGRAGRSHRHDDRYDNHSRRDYSERDYSERDYSERPRAGHEDQYDPHNRVSRSHRSGRDANSAYGSYDSHYGGRESESYRRPRRDDNLNYGSYDSHRGHRDSHSHRPDQNDRQDYGSYDSHRVHRDSHAHRLNRNDREDYGSYDSHHGRREHHSHRRPGRDDDVDHRSHDNHHSRHESHSHRRHGRAPERSEVFGSIDVIRDYPGASEALRLLSWVAAKVEPIMKRRGWSVPELAEFDVEDLTKLHIMSFKSLDGIYGFTECRDDKIHKIHIRLHYVSSSAELLPKYRVVLALLHELAHFEDQTLDGEGFRRVFPELVREWDSLYGQPSGGWPVM